MWSYCLVNFISMHIPFRKIQFHQAALMYVAMATMQLSAYFWILKSRLFCKYFRLRETFCEITFYGLDIKIVLSVQSKLILGLSLRKHSRKSFCPNMVINTKTTYQCHVSQSVIINLRHRNPSRVFFMVYNYIFSSFKWFELCYCSRTDFNGFGGNRKQLNIPLAP